MSPIIPSAAPQQTPVALNHLAPVVDLLSRSVANQKSAQEDDAVAGAGRWQMHKSLIGRAYHGAKSLLALVGAVAVARSVLLPLPRDAFLQLLQLPIVAGDGFFEPATIVARPMQD